MLRTKFTNLRRPARAQKSGIVVEPPRKKPKAASPEVVTESDLAEYRRHVAYLQQTYQSKKWTLSGTLCFAMELQLCTEVHVFQ